jgi:hypothetical protein
MNLETKQKQKCYYCKRNPCEDKYKNTEISSDTTTEFKGVYKYRKTKEHKYEAVRCRECFEVHKLGDKYSGFPFAIVYIISYGIMAYFNWGSGNYFAYFIFIFFAILPSYVIEYLFTYFIHSYYAKKHNTTPRWARGGNIM